MWPVLSLCFSEPWERLPGYSLGPGAITEMSVSDLEVGLTFVAEADKPSSSSGSSSASSSSEQQQAPSLSAGLCDLRLAILEMSRQPAQKTVDVLQAFFRDGTFGPGGADAEMAHMPSWSGDHQHPDALLTGNPLAFEQEAIRLAARAKKSGGGKRHSSSAAAALGNFSSAVSVSDTASVAPSVSDFGGCHTPRAAAAARMAACASPTASATSVAGFKHRGKQQLQITAKAEAAAAAATSAADVIGGGAAGGGSAIVTLDGADYGPVTSKEKVYFSGELLECVEGLARILSLASSSVAARGTVPYREWRTGQLAQLVDGFAQQMATLTNQSIIGWRGARFDPAPDHADETAADGMPEPYLRNSSSGVDDADTGAIGTGTGGEVENASQPAGAGIRVDDGTTSGISAAARVAEAAVASADVTNEMRQHQNQQLIASLQAQAQAVAQAQQMLALMQVQQHQQAMLHAQSGLSGYVPMPTAAPIIEAGPLMQHQQEQQQQQLYLQQQEQQQQQYATDGSYYAQPSASSPPPQPQHYYAQRHTPSGGSISPYSRGVSGSIYGQPQPQPYGPRAGASSAAAAAPSLRSPLSSYHYGSGSSSSGGSAQGGFVGRRRPPYPAYAPNGMQG